MERQLLLTSQQNYNRLKHKFEQLMESRDKERNQWNKELTVRISQEQRLQKEMEGVKSFVQGLLEELTVEKEYRSQLFEEFKAKTLGEVHNLYRTQLETLAEDFSSTREQCQKLLQLNSLLETECRTLEEKKKQDIVEHQIKMRQLSETHGQDLLEMQKQHRLKSHSLRIAEEELSKAKQALLSFQTNRPAVSGELGTATDTKQMIIEVAALKADLKTLENLLQTKERQCQRLESLLEQNTKTLNLQNSVIDELRKQLMDEEDKSTQTIERLYHQVEAKELEITELKTHYRGLLSRMKRLVVTEGKKSSIQHVNLPITEHHSQ
uniref:Growth arrest-specific protein 8 n=1 Tax=Ditylenchus dipsaci TaxID=166011 RepID=A0A915CXF5_9BILA